MPSMSRGHIWVGLRPRAWRVLYQHLELSDGVFYHGRLQSIHLKADTVNTANVDVRIQDSPDGITWTTRWASVNPLVPGGDLRANCSIRQPYVRCIVYSTGTGMVQGSWLQDERQVLPYLQPGDHLALACTSQCEQGCETTGQT